jgi:hypothetical protein
VGAIATKGLPAIFARSTTRAPTRWLKIIAMGSAA